MMMKNDRADIHWAPRVSMHKIRALYLSNAQGIYDDELIDALRIVLEKDPLVHADQLALHAQDGRVTIEGFLASDEERQLALLDAWYVPGVHEVIDRIQTRG